MAKAVIMPRQGQSVESCIISQWHKKVGDKIVVGDILFTYETDKATFDEEAQDEGNLLAIFFEEGDDVPVLTNVCVIGNEGENFDEFLPQGAKVQVEEEKEVFVEQKEDVANTMSLESDAQPVIMPRQGQSVESCIISQWHKKVGDKVSVGDLLFSYETDKASFEEEAKIEGTLLAIFFEEGDDVQVLKNVAVIGNEGDNYMVFSPHLDDSVGQVEEEVKKEVIVQTKTPETIERDRVNISPRAKNLAKQKGINPSFVEGSGPYGRIIEEDIKAFADSGPTYASMDYADPAMAASGIGGRISVSDLSAEPVKIEESKDLEYEYEDVKLTNVRKVIARTMHTSLSEMAQLTLNSSFDASNILNYRKEIKNNMEKQSLENITLNDIILYAVSRTALNHKDVNAHYLNDKIRHFKNVHLGVAVDTDRGLLVPTLFNSNQKSLNEISRETKELAKMANSGTINPDLLQGASLTITNLGTLGIESFTPVINPPQTVILGVNTLETKVRNVNGEVKMYQAMSLSLTFDHRAIDGAPAARFLQELCKNLENFTTLLAK